MRYLELNHVLAGLNAASGWRCNQVWLAALPDAAIDFPSPCCINGV
jgi:hypothetical protein